MRWMWTYWVATALAIGTSTWRAFNLGHASFVYGVSGVCCVPFVYRAYERRETDQIVLHAFYLVTSLIGAYRWHSS